MELGPKRLELMHQLLPKATVIALVVNPTNPRVAEIQSRDAQEAARALGLQLQILHASTEAEFDKVVANLPKGAGGLVIGSGDLFFFLSQTAKLAAITVRHGVPAMFHGREFMAAGGLIGYGGSVADFYHLAGIYTGRVLTGEKPADLPVQRSSKVEMYINLKTAKSLGLTVPPGLVIAADEVIERGAANSGDDFSRAIGKGAAPVVGYHYEFRERGWPLLYTVARRPGPFPALRSGQLCPAGWPGKKTDPFACPQGSRRRLVGRRL